MICILFTIDYPSHLTYMRVLQYFLSGDHQGITLTYFPPGTVFTQVPKPEITDGNRAGLEVYNNIAEAENLIEAPGFLAFLTVPVMTQARVDAITDGTWNDDDPPETKVLSYLFDLGAFFSSLGQHSGGNQEPVSIVNGFYLGKIINDEATESHKTTPRLAEFYVQKDHCWRFSTTLHLFLCPILKISLRL